MNQSELDRFLRKVRINRATGCWEWTGSLCGRDSSYAALLINGKSMYAHRASYEHYVGPLVPRMDIDHKCMVKHCVNPDHLQQVDKAAHQTLAVKRKENYRSAQTHCIRGHEFTEENTYYYKQDFKEVSRSCKACSMARQVERRRGK